MTMDELAALSDSQLEPFLHMTHLIFAGEERSRRRLFPTERCRPPSPDSCD